MYSLVYSILSVKRNHEKLRSLLVGMKGISGVDLHAVSFDEITAVVSNIKIANLIADQSNAIAYAGVIENLAQQFTLLPVRFGCTMESTDEIIKTLGRNYHAIQYNLQKVENKYEFGLKIFCDPEKLKAELKSKTETDPGLGPVQGNENSIYRDYLDKKLKQHRFEEMLLAHVDTIIQDITSHLAQWDPIQKFKKMVTETTLIDAVFLLDKKRKDDLIHAVRDLQNQYPALNFVLTGPWPPYNFVEININ